MKLENALAIPGAPDEVFNLLLDLERIASCMPGCTLTGHDDDAYQGQVKVKVGPLSMTYSGNLRFLEVDREARSATMKATGKEMKGQGSADALIKATVGEHEGGSELTIETDLQIRGRAAQFGRSAIGDVSQKIMQTFATNVGGLLQASPTPSSPSADRPLGQDQEMRASAAPTTTELDMGNMVLRLAAERIGPGLLVALVIWLVFRKKSG
jgi:carbon monoxide dehydrogenase subunit G